MDPAELMTRFRFYPADETTGPKHERVRAACLELGLELIELVAPGREQSIMITKLEEVMYWANAGIARVPR